jgi:sterol desaturase/sphingolipid hydroxylase (fatty acid hydroxylase superfamily)
MQNDLKSAAKQGRAGTDKPKRLTLFQNPVLEFSTYSHPLAAMAVWMPIGLISLCWPEISTSAEEIGIVERAFLGLAGVIVWGLAEYAIHRWIFHFPAKRELSKRLVFVIHGCHHVDPQDARRNMMPLGASIPIGLAVFCSAWWLLGTTPATQFFGTFALAYLAYDVVHFALHQLKSSNRLFRVLQERHRTHHFRNARKNYATLSTWVDDVFDTAAK